MKFNDTESDQEADRERQLLEIKLLVSAYNGEANAARTLLAFWAMLKLKGLPISVDLDRAVTLLQLEAIAHGQLPWKLGRKKAEVYRAKERNIQAHYAYLIDEGMSRREAIESLAKEYHRETRSIERDIRTINAQGVFEPDSFLEKLQSFLPGTGPRGLAVNSAVWEFITKVNDKK